MNNYALVLLILSVAFSVSIGADETKIFKYNISKTGAKVIGILTVHSTVIRGLFGLKTGGDVEGLLDANITDAFGTRSFTRTYNSHIIGQYNYADRLSRTILNIAEIARKYLTAVVVRAKPAVNATTPAELTTGAPISTSVTVSVITSASSSNSATAASTPAVNAAGPTITTTAASATTVHPVNNAAPVATSTSNEKPTIAPTTVTPAADTVAPAAKTTATSAPPASATTVPPVTPTATTATPAANTAAPVAKTA